MSIPAIYEKFEGDRLMWDLYSRQLKDRIIWLGAEVTTPLSNLIVAQLLYLDTVDKNKDIHFYINSPGGCLTADSRIPTSKGMKDITDIKIGDFVYACDTNTKTLVLDEVTDTMYSGKKEVYELIVGNRKIKASSNHKFLVVGKSTPYKNRPLLWKSVNELKIGDTLVIPKGLPEEATDSFVLPSLGHYTRPDHIWMEKGRVAPTVTNDDFLWLCGVLLGDSNYSKEVSKAKGGSSHKITFCVPREDPIQLSIKCICKDLFNIVPSESAQVGYLHLYSKRHYDWFEKLGMVGKAKTKRIPEWVFSLPRSQRLSCIGGLLDSDGSISISDEGCRGRAYKIELCNKKLVEDILLLANLSGLCTSKVVATRTRKTNYCDVSISYNLTISGDIDLIPTNNLIKRTKLKKLKTARGGKSNRVVTNHYNNFGTNRFIYKNPELSLIGCLKLTSKKLVGTEKVYDISTRCHHNFIANGIIVHNSITAGMAIYDTMNYIAAEVSTICVGHAASMSSFLLAAGAPGKRFVLPNAEVMIHQPLGGFQGQATDIAIHAKHILSLKARLNQMLAKHTGQKLKTIERDTDRDNYMTAEEAVAYGLADKVVARRDKDLYVDQDE